MPKRNIVWIAIGVVVAALLWRVPEALIRRDTLYSEFEPLLDVQAQIRKHYVDELDEDKLLRGAIDGMLEQLDPFSEYYSDKEYDVFRTRTEGRLEGIGVEVVEIETGEIVIVSPIEGSPAFRAGLRAGDRITHVEGQPTAEMKDLREATEKIQGSPGSEVRLTLYRPSTEEVFDKTIRRELVIVPTIRGWARTPDGRWEFLIEPQAGIGYVRILSFERMTAEQLDGVISDMLNEHALRGLVIDVRDNPGGLLDVVVHIVNRFVSRGKIVSTIGRFTSEQVYVASPENTYPQFPLVILVNQGSASASEILAGSLKDHDRATIVGAKTYGKGSVQEIIPVDHNHGYLKLTTGYYYLPEGERIHGKGIVPEVVVELTPEEIEALHRSQLQMYGNGMNSATQPSTRPGDDRVEIMIDRQLQTALDLLHEKLGTSAP